MPAIAQLREKSRLTPVCLAEITLKNSGPTLYLSDRNLTVGGQPYEAYLKDLSGLGEEICRADSSALNADIELVFGNDKWRSYNHLIEAGEVYPFEGAVCVIKECYLDDDGTPSEAVTVFKGCLDEPRDIDLTGFRCKVSSVPYVMDRLWNQPQITTASYPNAYEDAGKYEPIVYGSSVLMPALRTDWGARSSLKAALTATQTTLELSDASRFPSSGEIWVDTERMSYASKAGNVLSGLARGGSKTAHRAGAEVWQYKDSYYSLLARHALHTVGDIYAEIRGQMLRVGTESDVFAAFTGGKHFIYISRNQVSVKPLEDTIGLESALDVENNIEFSMQGLDTTDVTPNSATQNQGGTITSPQYAIDGDPNTSADKTTGLVWQDALIIGFYRPPEWEGEIINQTVSVTYEAGGPVDLGSGWGSDLPTTYIKATVTRTKNGGNLEDSISFKNSLNNWFKIYEVTKKVTYRRSLAKSGEAWLIGEILKKGGLVGVRLIERFHAAVSGHKDDASGTYTGAPNALIERPDHVIHHFLRTYCGAAASEIDTASFAAAGAAYAGYISGGYKFAFMIGEKIKPSEFLKRLAFECRSTLTYKGGKWYLNAISDTVPSSVKTITKGELAGQFAKFRFGKTTITEIANSITARYKRAYSRMRIDGDWHATVTADEAASKTKYGTYPKEFGFEAIRVSTTAQSVLNHILAQRKTTLLVVEFPVFWEHFDLAVGDTIQVENDLFNGKKFFIEKIERAGAGQALIRAIEWWG